MQIRTARDGESTGIWEISELQAALDRGEVLGTDLVWKTGDPDWQVLADVAAELGVTLPKVSVRPADEPPPIPKEAAPATPQRATASIHASSGARALEAPTVPSALNEGELVFRRKKFKKSYGFGWAINLGILVVVLGGGWRIFETIQARVDYLATDKGGTLNEKSATSDGTAKVNSHQPTPQDLINYLKSHEGVRFDLYIRGNKRQRLYMFIKDGDIYHCSIDESIKSCSDLRLPIKVEVENVYAIPRASCVAAGYQVAVNNFMGRVFCIATADMTMSSTGDTVTRDGLSESKFSKGEIFYILMLGESLKNLNLVVPFSIKPSSEGLPSLPAESFRTPLPQPQQTAEQWLQQCKQESAANVRATETNPFLVEPMVNAAEQLCVLRPEYQELLQGDPDYRAAQQSEQARKERESADRQAADATAADQRRVAQEEELNSQNAAYDAKQAQDQSELAASRQREEDAISEQDRQNVFKQQRDLCERYAIVMKSEVAKGNVSLDSVKSGLSQRGCDPSMASSAN